MWFFKPESVKIVEWQTPKHDRQVAQKDALSVV